MDDETRQYLSDLANWLEGHCAAGEAAESGSGQTVPINRRHLLDIANALRGIATFRATGELEDPNVDPCRYLPPGRPEVRRKLGELAKKLDKSQSQQKGYVAPDQRGFEAEEGSQDVLSRPLDPEEEGPSFLDISNLAAIEDMIASNPSLLKAIDPLQPEDLVLDAPRSSSEMRNQASADKSKPSGPPRIIEFEPPPKDPFREKLIEAHKSGDKEEFARLLKERWQEVRRQGPLAGGPPREIEFEPPPRDPGLEKLLKTCQDDDPKVFEKALREYWQEQRRRRAR